MTSADFSAIVAAIRDVPGVVDADVEPDPAGGMGTLRLGLADGVDEAWVASSVGRLLREQFGLGVDAEQVQIVEDSVVRDMAAVDAPHQRLAGRPAISRMHLVSSGVEVTATVTLSSDGRTADGECTDSASPSGVQRAVAAATLRSVEALSGGLARFELEHVEVAQLGSERTVVVALTMVSSLGTDRLTGAAAVREDVRQAVIRATLDALNRRLETLLA